MSLLFAFEIYCQAAMNISRTQKHAQKNPQRTPKMTKGAKRTIDIKKIKDTEKSTKKRQRTQEKNLYTKKDKDNKKHDNDSALCIHSRVHIER